MLRVRSHRSHPFQLCAAAALIAVVLSARQAQAQPFTPSITPNASPIVVSTQPEKIVVARPKVEQQTVLNVVFGATINGGNTKSYGGSLGGRAGYIRDRHQLTLEALGSMGGARQEDSEKVAWTSRQVVARLRYDLFLSQHDALFVALAPRRDVNAGLNLRLQNQIGYLRNLFYFSDAHRFWSELGYDLTFDRFSVLETTVNADITDQIYPDPALRPEGVTVTQSTTTRERGKDRRVHSARIFLGYANRLFASANLSVGLETLLDFQDADNVRLNGLAELTSSITQSFKLGVQGRVLYDHVPVPGTRNFDTVAAVQLVYTFDSLAGMLVATCPACDCSAQVEAARKECKTSDPQRATTR